MAKVEGDLSPMDWLLTRLRCKQLTDDLRDRIAIALMPYCHPRLAAVAVTTPQDMLTIEHRPDLDIARQIAHTLTITSRTKH